MDNNKYRLKDREKSNAELRKMFPKDGAHIGIVDGEKVGSRDMRVGKNRSKEPTY